MFFIDNEVAGVALLFTETNLFTALQLGNDTVDAEILICRFFAGAADDERGAGFIDQDRIHFIDDCEMMAALNAFSHVELHVVAKIVESVLVISAVSDVGGVCSASLVV